MWCTHVQFYVEERMIRGKNRPCISTEKINMRGDAFVCGNE